MPNPWEENYAKSPWEEDYEAQPEQPPESPALGGIPRGFVRGLRRGVGAVGGAMQAVSPEESGVSKVGKAIEEFGAAGDVLPEQKGFWEKGAEMGGMIAPMIAASVLAPEVAAVPISAGFASLFGLQQMHETEQSMKKAGLEPGVAPLATGGATALAMVAAPFMIGRFLTKPIASMISKEVAQQTIGSVVKPTALDLIKKAGLAALSTEGIFLAQTGTVSGVEKSYGLPHDIPAELWETAKGAAAMSLMGGAVGYPVRRMLDNVHVANLSKPVDVTNVPEEKQQAYLDTHSKVRSSYAEVVARMLDHGDRKDLGDAWRAYADDKIKNNEPIDMNMTLDQVSLGAEALQGKVARDMGLNKELEPQTDENNETEKKAQWDKEQAIRDGYSIMSDEQLNELALHPDNVYAREEADKRAKERKDVLAEAFGLGDLSALEEGLKPPKTPLEPKKAEQPTPEEKVAPKPKAKEKKAKLTPEQKITAWDAKEAIFGMLKGKVGKTPIIFQIAKYQAENPNITTNDLIKRYIAESGAALVKKPASEQGEARGKVVPTAKEDPAEKAEAPFDEAEWDKQDRRRTQIAIKGMLEDRRKAEEGKKAETSAEAGTEAPYTETPEGQQTLREMQEHLRENTAGEKVAESEYGGVTSTGERFTTYEPWVGEISKKFKTKADEINTIIEKYLKTGGVGETVRKGQLSDRQWGIFDAVRKVANKKGREYQARIEEHGLKEQGEKLAMTKAELENETAGLFTDNLRPALNKGNKIVEGEIGQTHNDIENKYSMDTLNRTPEEHIAELKNAIEDLQKKSATHNVEGHIKTYQKKIKQLEKGAPEEERGFVTPEGKFLNRKEAANWLRNNRPDLWEKLPKNSQKELHSEDLAAVSGVKKVEPLPIEKLQEHQKALSDGTMKPEEQIDLASNLDAEDKRIADEGKDVAAGCEQRGKLKIGK